MNTQLVEAPASDHRDCMLVDDFGGGVEGRRHGIEDLSRRELEALVLISKGCLRKEIALEMNISRGTVDQFIKRIYDKLRVHSKTEAAVKYLEHLARIGLF